VSKHAKLLGSVAGKLSPWRQRQQQQQYRRGSSSDNSNDKCDDYSSGTTGEWVEWWLGQVD